MKTEPTKAYEHLRSWWFEALEDDFCTTDSANEAIKIAFQEGQISPKIKQLEWVEVNSLGEIGIKAKTSVGDYYVYEKSDHDGYVLWCLEKDIHMFDTEIQAKTYAQADFERRVLECLG